MIPVTKEFLRRVEDRGAEFAPTAFVTLKSGDAITLTGDDLRLSNNSIYDGAGANVLPLGVAVSRGIQIEIMNVGGRFTGVDFTDAEIELQLGLMEEILPMGTFTVLTSQTYGGTIIITAQDDMHRADKPFTAAVLYPVSLRELFRVVCEECGLTADVSGLPNGDYAVVRPIPAGLTCRAIIGYIAMLAGGNAHISRTRQLEILTYDFAGLERAREEEDPEGVDVLRNWINLRVDLQDVVITGIQTTRTVTAADGSIGSQTIICGSEGYVLTVDNPLIAGNETAALELIANVLVGGELRSFVGDHTSWPLAEFMDLCRIYDDRSGTVYHSIITDLNIILGGMTTLSNSAETPTRSSAAYTTQADKALVKAYEADAQLERRVNSYIEQTAESIEAGVSEAYETKSDATSKYNELNSQITITAEGIEQSVAETYTTKSTFNTTVQNLQDQIDDSIETFTGSAVPTLNNAPAKNWKTATDRDSHIGDLYIVNSSGGDYAGFYYRFEKSGSTYQWVLLKDTEITKALADAASAKAAADAVGEDLETNYSTTTEMNSAIQQSASSITSTVSATYETKSDATAKLNSANSHADTVAGDAESAAKGYTDTKLTSYSTTAQMNSAISQSASSITSTVSATYETKSDATSKLNTAKSYAESEADAAESSAKSYADTQVSSAKSEIKQTTDAIESTVSTKVGNDEVISKINQSAEQITIDANRVDLQGVVSFTNVVSAGRNIALGTGTPITVKPYQDKNWCSPSNIYTTTPYGMSQLADTDIEKFTVSFDWSATGVDTAVSAYAALRYMENGTYRTVGVIIPLTVGDCSGHSSIAFTPISGMRQWGTGWMISGLGTNNRNAEITLSNFKFEVGSVATHWTKAPEDVEDAIESVSETASGANSREQTIYISKVTGTTSVAANTTWVTNTTGGQNTWTTKRPVFDRDHPVLFVATQRQTVAQMIGTDCSCTTPMIDDTTTVIDGGHIITGSITAGAIAAGAITSTKLGSDVSGQISNAQSTADSASSAASSAQSTANGANYREQVIYRSAASGTSSMDANTTWVTSTTDSQGAWRTRRPTYNSSYPVLFVATQRQTVAQSGGTTCSCTTPVIDKTTTVIDGGNIITGTVTANQLAANSVTAEKIKAGEVTSAKLAADSVTADKIKAGEVTSAKLAADSVTADKIKSGEITSDKIATGAILIGNLASSTVTGITDTVQIGGRNFVLKSDEQISVTVGTSSSVTTKPLSDFGKTELGTVGTKCTISFDAKSDVAGTQVGGRYIRNSSSTPVTDVTDKNLLINLTTDWVRYSGTCNITATGAAIIGFYVPAGTAGSKVFIKNIKVETGTKATDWTPAPEDVAAGIDAVQTNVDTVQTNLDNLQVGGRNLFIASTRTPNYYITDTGSAGGWAQTVLSDYIAVTENENIILQVWKPENTAATGNNRGWYCISTFDDSKGFVARPKMGYFTNDYQIAKYVIPSGVGFVRITYHFGGDGPSGFDWDPCGDFKVKVERGDKATDWSLAPEDVADQNRSLYGVNLLLGTENERNLKNATTDYLFTDLGTEQVTAYTFVTVSFEAKTTEPGHSMDFYFRYNNNGTETNIGVGSYIITNLTADYQRYTRVLQMPNVSYPYVKIRVRSNSSVSGGSGTATVNVKNLKLEIGNRATPYSKSEDDIDALAKSASEMASAANTLAAGKSTVYYSTSNPPTSGTYNAGDVWIKQGTGQQEMWTYTGSAWSKHIAGTTSIMEGAITTDLLATNAVTAEKIKAGSIYANKILISDYTNLATITEKIPDYTIALQYYGGAVVQDGYITKSSAAYNSMMVREWGNNDCHAGDEFYYEFTAHTDTAGTAYIRWAGARVINPTTASQVYGVVSKSFSVTTSDQRFTGTIKLPETVGSTAIDAIAFYCFYFYSAASSLGKIYVKDLTIKLKGGGNLIVDGSITADKISVTDLSALNATIGGFDIGTTSIHNGMTSMSDTTHDGVYVGTDGIAIGKGAFKVDNAGALTAKNASLNGNLFTVGDEDTSENPPVRPYVFINNGAAEFGTVSGTEYSSPNKMLTIDGAGKMFGIARVPQIKSEDLGDGHAIIVSAGETMYAIHDMDTSGFGVGNHHFIGDVVMADDLDVKGTATINGLPPILSKLLWTNDSPTTEFAAQNVDILTLPDYDMVYIGYGLKTGSANTRHGDWLNFASNVIIKSNLEFNDYDDGARYIRNVTFSKTAKKVLFTATKKFAAGSATSSTDNTFCIPEVIYGIKL